MTGTAGRALCAGALFVLAMGFVPVSLFAADANNYWKVAAGDWFDANCWSKGTVGGDYSSIDNGGTATISGSRARAGYLFVGSTAGHSGAVSLTGGTLDCGQMEYVGYSGTGTFAQSDGNNTAYRLYLGYNAGSSGTYAMSGPARMTFSIEEYVGFYGAGTITQGGGSNATALLYLGHYAGSSGNYVLNGPGSLTVSDAEWIGLRGTASFTQTDGNNTVSAALWLANESGSSGTYQLTGGRLSAAQEGIGRFGAGAIIQSGGVNTVGGSLTLGWNPGSWGSYTLGGTGCLTAGAEVVGVDGNALFSQTGGTNSTQDLSIGIRGRYAMTGGSLQVGRSLDNQGVLDFGGSAAAINVAPDSTVNLLTGTVLNAGSASLSIEANSIVFLPAGVDPNTVFGHYSSAGTTYTSDMTFDVGPGQSVSLAGAIPIHVNAAGSLQAPTGAKLNLCGGVSVVSGGQVTVGELRIDEANSSLADGGVLTTTYTHVGYRGAGAFVQSGGNHNVAIFSVGHNAGTSGSYTLSGGRLAISSDEYVGESGTGTLTNTNGTNTVRSYLYLGYNPGSSGTYVLNGTGRLDVSGPSATNQYVGYNGVGTFIQSDGTNAGAIRGGLYVGYGAGSSGTYQLSGTGVVQMQSEYIGGSGAGLFQQSGGSNFASALSVSGAASSPGTYQLSGGRLEAYTQYIGNGATGVFTQSGGINVAGNLHLAQLTGASGTYTLNGPGDLLVTNEEWVCYGYNATAAFNQSDGNNTAETLLLGSSSSTDTGVGNYTLSGKGRLLVTYQEGIVAGTFTQTGGDHTVQGDLGIGTDTTAGPTANYVLSGPGRLYVTGSEYVGRRNNYRSSFTQSDGNNTVGGSLSIGDLYGTPATYTLSGSGSVVASSLYVGRIGTFNQTGGTNTDGNVFIRASQGLYRLAGGTLTVTGCLVNDGALDFGKSASVLNIGPNGIANLSVGAESNAKSATLSLDAGAALFVPAGFDPNAVFGYYTNLGTMYTPDMTFVVGAGRTVSLSGRILCGVSTAGAVQAIGPYLDLYGGVNVLSGGRASLRDLRVEDANSGLSAGTLATAGVEYIGYSGTGVFTQTDGNNNDGNYSAGLLYLGYSAGSSGTYVLSGRGRLTDGNVYVGLFGTGSFVQSDGNHWTSGTLYLGYNNGSSGSYSLSGRGRLNVRWDEYIGNTGTGSFTQSDGNNTVGNHLYLAYNAHSSGSYALNGPGRLTVRGIEFLGYSGTGTFTQSDGSHSLSGILYIGYNTGSSGSYVLSGLGWLSVGGAEYVGYSGTGTFTQSDGNHVLWSPLYIGYSTGSSGSYVLSGPGRLTVDKAEYIGYSGTGSFTQSGGYHAVGNLYMGYNSVSSASYRMDGPGRLIDANAFVGFYGPATFTQSDGNHTMAGTLYLGYYASCPSATYQLSGRGRLAAAKEYIGMQGSGLFQQSGGLNSTGYLSVGTKGRYVLTGGTLALTGALQADGTLDLREGDGNFSGCGAVTIGGGGGIFLGAGPKTCVFNSLTIIGVTNAWTGKLDIGGGCLVVKVGNLATITNQVKQGMNQSGGYWDGNGITSRLAAADTNFYTAVGVLDNALAHYTTFGDSTGLTGSEVLVRYTFYGDADLSGTVDFDNDYILWQTGFLNGYTGWVYGDFNYDGVVDFDNDYILWQTLFLNQPALPGGAAEAGAAGGADFGGSSAVPEPATLLLLGLGAAGVLGRRRNRK